MELFSLRREQGRMCRRALIWKLGWTRDRYKLTGSNYDVKCVYECQEVSNTALHNFLRPQALKEEIRNENKNLWTHDLRIRSPSLYQLSYTWPGGSDELASSAGSRCLASVTSRREKFASLPSLQKWRWQTDVRVRATNVFFVLLSFQLSLFSWVVEF